MHQTTGVLVFSTTPTRCHLYELIFALDAIQHVARKEAPQCAPHGQVFTNASHLRARGGVLTCRSYIFFVLQYAKKAQTPVTMEFSQSSLASLRRNSDRSSAVRGPPTGESLGRLEYTVKITDSDVIAAPAPPMTGNFSWSYRCEAPGRPRYHAPPIPSPGPPPQ